MHIFVLFFGVKKVLEDFPSVQMPLEWLIQLVPLLKTRAFSISSSQSAHPNQVHLTLNVVSWTTPYKRKKKGLCSSWLAALDPNNGMHEKLATYCSLFRACLLQIIISDFDIQ
jgi:sulfite reductase alpha subunit-like flavoprotein